MTSATFAALTAATLALCDWQPTREVAEAVYSVKIYAPWKGVHEYVARAMCEAREVWHRPQLEAGRCARVNNVCLND